MKKDIKKAFNFGFMVGALMTNTKKKDRLSRIETQKYFYDRLDKLLKKYDM